MPTRDSTAAWQYHDATKHTFESVRSSAHHLDWSNQPIPFKLYRTLEPIPLPRDASSAGMAALDAIGAPPPGESMTPLDVRALAHLLFYSAGLTKRKQYPGGEIAFRAASCTGALYEIELYLACGDLRDLPAGVYHFGPADFALRRLRAGDFRSAIASACADPRIARAPAIVICTGTYWRNAWKYRARTYRHSGWDNGTILANLIAAAAAQGLAVRVVTAFVDAGINELLALDTMREVTFSIIAVGHTDAVAPDAPRIEHVNFEYDPPSRTEVDYPIMRAIHEASSLTTDQAVRQWREDAEGSKTAKAQGQEAENAGYPQIALQPLTEPPRDRLEDVIMRRGSTRRFARGAAWTLAQLSTAVMQATRRIEADFTPGSDMLNDLYLIVHAVEGLTSGAYFFDRRAGSLVLLKSGDFRADAGYLGLEQELPADGSLVAFLLADLRQILDRLGNRGYRATQLEAGIIGGRLYLAAYAQRLGASGLTFYDDEVVRFFSPHAAGKSAIFCVALGKSVSR
jgi:SagB-type dehydrogenase family enzyme